MIIILHTTQLQNKSKPSISEIYARMIPRK